MMNIVNSAYHHSSLGLEINVIVVDIVHLSDDEQITIHTRPKEREETEDSETDQLTKKGQDTLKNFCIWSSSRWHRAYEKRYTDKLFDVAVYLTKQQLGPADLLVGYAPVTGMCNPDRSCAVIRDDGISSAFVIAHEIGHIFGMVHDGEGAAAECKDETNDGKIMAAMVQSNYHNYYWSNCSKQVLEDVLEELYCLDNEPDDTLWPRYSEPYGQSWSLDEQCRQEFGTGYIFCQALPHNCEHLWCENPTESTMCRTKRSPPLSGTTCGKNMWCLDGLCVNTKNTPRVDGQWSEWSEWGQCSRTCGVGVQYRYRICNNPTPQYGGQQCADIGEDFRICNKENCPTATDFRFEQCQFYNEENFVNSKRHNWLPLESKNISEMCKLTCTSEESRESFTTEKNVVDGTFCSYESSNNICIKGDCHLMGCDNELGSGVVEDECGVCGGDNMNCTTVSMEYTQTLATGQYHHILILPQHAMNIRIRERTPFHLAHFIAVRDVASEKFWLNGDSKLDMNRQFVVHRTRFLYFRNKNGEYLTARGPLLAPIEILIYSFSDRIPVEMEYQYYMPTDKHEVRLQGPSTQPERYKWAVTSLDQCTRPCGGGHQREMFECLDVETSMVSHGLCTGSHRPGGATISCNTQVCTTTVYLWEVSSWQKCSHSCGDSGFKYRKLTCEATLHEDQWSVDDIHCDQSTRPDVYKQCNRMACPAHWNVGEWSVCSQTCGKGEERREYYCDKPNDDNKYTCDHLEHPTTHRTCTIQLCPGDESMTTASTGNQTDLMSTHVVAQEYNKLKQKHINKHKDELEIQKNTLKYNNDIKNDSLKEKKLKKPKKRRNRKSKKKNHAKKSSRKRARMSCRVDLSGLVCKIAANRKNCLTNNIYKKLCCKSCAKYRKIRRMKRKMRKY